MFVCHCYLAVPCKYLKRSINVSLRLVQAYIFCLKLGTHHTMESPIITLFWPWQQVFIFEESLEWSAENRTGHFGHSTHIIFRVCQAPGLKSRHSNRASSWLSEQLRWLNEIGVHFNLILWFEIFNNCYLKAVSLSMTIICKASHVDVWWAEHSHGV